MRVRNYADVTDRILAAVGKSERLTVWHQATTAPSPTPYPLYCLRYTAQPKNPSLIYVSAGIHGNEPAGVECAIRLIELLAGNHQTNSLFPFDTYNWLISPCDNPYGYERDIRENAEGLDLNRVFDDPTSCSETTFIVESLQQFQPRHTQKQLGQNTMDKRHRLQLALDLHEDIDSSGFYLWERRRSQHLPIGAAVVNNVETICSINREHLIEDHRNKNGVITLLDRVTTKGWTRGRYLGEQVNTRCLILETPTRLDWETRIAAHMVAIKTAIKNVSNAP